MTRRWFQIPIAMAVCLATCWSFGDGTGGTSPTAVQEHSPEGPHGREPQREHRMREGTRLDDQIGHFKLTGDRVTFYRDEDQRQFPALENLALERIARILSETEDALQWSVSGTITEFRGQNFLLVTRAIAKSRSTTP